jgi:formate dehydrogenase subunit delta
MHIERLIKMANDIGDFFQSEPNRAEAVGGIVNHLKRFWDPRMRRQICEHLRAGGEGLHELVREAVAQLQAESETAAV